MTAATLMVVTFKPLDSFTTNSSMSDSVSSNVKGHLAMRILVYYTDIYPNFYGTILK